MSLDKVAVHSTKLEPHIEAVAYDMSQVRAINDKYSYMRDIDPKTQDADLCMYRMLAKALDTAVRRVDQLETANLEAKQQAEPTEADRGYWTGKLQNCVSLHPKTSETPLGGCIVGSIIVEGTEQPASFFVDALRAAGEIGEAARFDRFASARTAHGATVFKPILPVLCGELRRVR